MSTNPTKTEASHWRTHESQTRMYIHNQHDPMDLNTKGRGVNWTKVKHPRAIKDMGNMTTQGKKAFKRKH